MNKPLLSLLCSFFVFVSCKKTDDKRSASMGAAESADVETAAFQLDAIDWILVPEDAELSYNKDKLFWVDKKNDRTLAVLVGDKDKTILDFAVKIKDLEKLKDAYFFEVLDGETLGTTSEEQRDMEIVVISNEEYSSVLSDLKSINKSSSQLQLTGSSFQFRGRRTPVRNGLRAAARFTGWVARGAAQVGENIRDRRENRWNNGIGANLPRNNGGEPMYPGLPRNWGQRYPANNQPTQNTAANSQNNVRNTGQPVFQGSCSGGPSGTCTLSPQPTRFNPPNQPITAAEEIPAGIPVADDGTEQAQEQEETLTSSTNQSCMDIHGDNTTPGYRDCYCERYPDADLEVCKQEVDWNKSCMDIHGGDRTSPAYEACWCDRYSHHNPELCEASEDYMSSEEADRLECEETGREYINGQCQDPIEADPCYTTCKLTSEIQEPVELDMNHEKYNGDGSHKCYVETVEQSGLCGSDLNTSFLTSDGETCGAVRAGQVNLPIDCHEFKD